MTVQLRFRLASLLLLPLVAAGPAWAGDHEKPGTITFVESWPEETALDLSDLPDAANVWRDVIAAARGRIDIASFYFSRLGDGKDASGPPGVVDRLRPVLEEVVSAGTERGVQVRVLADARFERTYPEVPAWLGTQTNTETRILDTGKLWGGGVLHAKYFLVDDDAFYVGSQNWDWRALTQIHELGVLVRSSALAADLRAVYEMDWALAGAEEPCGEMRSGEWHPLITAGGDTVSALLVASPQDHLPAGVPWDLPRMIELIDSARDSVHLQLLSFGESDREGRLFDDLDRALRRATVRGARVRMILSNWSKDKNGLPWIQSLARIPGIEIRFTNIPEHSGGFIPFARVEHAKYLTVDGQGAWIGTSNWSRDYFYSSRNVGLVLRGAGAARDPDRFFNLSWHGPYAETVDPCGSYAPPRRQ